MRSTAAPQDRSESQHILHVTESFAAGVMESILRMSKEQARCGAQVEVVYLRRPDSPSAADLVARTPLGVSLFRVDERGSSLVGLVRLVRVVSERMRGDRALVVHVHSSLAGGAVRARFAHRASYWRRIYYSPHGFSFLRQDLNPAKRRTLRWVETLLAKVTAGLVLVSQSERELAQDVLHVKRASVVENGVDLKSVPVRRAQPSGKRPVVVTVGRIVYQKAPWRFAELARRYGDRVDFVWIGQGADLNEALIDAGVEITGWLPHERVVDLLNAADIFVLGSLWEGMPLALIESQCMGLPALVMDIVGCRDVVQDGVTGIVATTDQQFQEALGTLLDSPKLRDCMSANAISNRDRFDARRLGPASLTAYAEAG